MEKISKAKTALLIALCALALFLPFIGSTHLFDWDEINFAEAAREMLVTGDYLRVRIDFEPFHEKPPLFIWLQALSMSAFGVNEFAARLPNALIGAISLAFIFLVGAEVRGRKFGLLWATVYGCSLLPFFYFKSGLIDPLFNLFMFSSIYYIFRRYSEQGEANSRKYLYIAALLAAGAALTKGPVGWLLVALAWGLWHVIFRRKLRMPWAEFLIFMAIALAPLVAWFALVTPEAGFGIVNQFISYQSRLLTTGDAGHSGPFFYHFLVLLLGCFPASALAIYAFRSVETEIARQKLFSRLALALLLVVLIVFSIVKTKIVHYSSLAYFPVTYFGALAVWRFFGGEFKKKKAAAWTVLSVGALVSAFMTAIPLLLINKELIMPKVDAFTRAALAVESHWSGYEWLPGLLPLAGAVLAVIWAKKGKASHAFYALFGANLVAVFTFMALVVPKVEPHSQGSIIEFFQSKRGVNCYIQPLGFKTYAHYFYAEREPRNSAYYHGMEKGKFTEYLLTHQSDRPAYFVTKLKHAEREKAKYNLKGLYRKGGYVFFEK